MKKLFFVLALFIGLVTAKAQTGPVAQVATITQLKNYNGPSGLVFVSDSAKQGLYYICAACTADESLVYAGAGGKKWRRVVDYASLNGISDIDTTSLSNRINLKVNISDTAAALLPYLRKIDTVSLSNRINLKVNISDTANALAPYLREIDTASLSNRINLKVNISDTAAALAPYLREVDTASLSNRINGKVALGDNNTWAGDNNFEVTGTSEKVTITEMSGAVNNPLYVTYTGAGKGLAVGWRSIDFPNDNNSFIQFAANGNVYAKSLLLNKSVNDAVTAVNINQQQGTGHILDLKFGNVSKSYFDKDGILVAAGVSTSTVSNTEFGYLDGVTSAIQAQLLGKVGVSDTSSMLSPYLREIDTATLSNRINNHNHVVADVDMSAIVGDATLTDSALVRSGDTVVMRKVDITVTKADVGLGNVEDYSPTQLWALTKTLTSTHISFGAASGNTTDSIPVSAIRVSDTAMLDVSTFVTKTGSDTLTNKTITSPVISASSPSATVGAVTLHTKSARLGREELAIKTNRYLHSLQPMAARHQYGVILWQGAGGSSSTGLRAGTTQGTLTAVTISPSSTYSAIPKSAIVSGGAAGDRAGIPADIRRWYFSSTASRGGFTFQFIFGDGSSVSTQRGGAGMWGTDGVPTSVQPSTLTNFIGMAYDDTSSTYKIMHNDGSGSATQIDLGSNFPSKTASADMYILTLYVPAGNANYAEYFVERIGTAFTANGTITTNLPADGTRLGWVRWLTNSTTGAVTADISSISYEQEPIF